MILFTRSFSLSVIKMTPVKVTLKWCVAGSVCIGILALAVGALQQAKEMEWKSRAQFNSRNLALLIEVYRENSDCYPASLTALRETSGALEQSFLREVLDGGDEVQYLVTNNGFTITLIGPAKLFSTRAKLETHYELGEARSQFDWPKKSFAP